MTPKRKATTTRSAATGYREAMIRSEPETPLGELLRRGRAKAGLSQEEVGRQLGISQSVWARYEKGFHKPALYRLPKIAQLLDIPIAELTAAAVDSAVQMAREDGAPRPQSAMEQMQAAMLDMAAELEALRKQVKAQGSGPRSGGKPSARKQA